MPSAPRRIAPDVGSSKNEMDISPEMLEALPDVDAQRRSAAALDGDDEEILELTPIATPSPSSTTPDLGRLFEDMRHDMESSFARELDRVEASFRALLTTLDSRVMQAESALESARAENERVKADHARKTDTLRELKRALDKL